MKKFFAFISYLSFYYLSAQDQAHSVYQVLDSIQISSYNYHNLPQVLPKTVRVIKIGPLQAAAIESLDDILKLVGGVDVRTRGSKGVQADVSIRGGNFDQVLILLNGVPINNPQTGHHSLDLPVDFSMLDRIEILEGASAQSFGVNAYSGAINLITKNPDKEQAQSTLKIGQFGYVKTDFDLAHRFDKISVYNGFTYQRSTGYLTNDSINNTDFYTIKDFVNVYYHHDKFPIDLQAGYHQKDFGANSFYTSKYPWQYEKTHGYFAALSSRFGKKIKYKPSLFYKLHFDEFQLFRESEYSYQNGFFIHKQDTAQYAPGIYYPGHNYHKTQEFGGALQLQLKSKFGQSFVNLSLRKEQIWSNKLGKNLLNPIKVTDRIVYIKSDSRSYFEANLNQNKQWQNWTVGGGINLLYEPAYHWQVTGGGFVNYRSKHFTHYINVSSASRLPTFTDLYYQGPSNIGNPDLKPETAVTYEAGSKYFDKNNYITAAVFLRNADRTIDWIKYQAADKWQPQNLTRLQTYGVEMTLKHRFDKGFIKNINLSYAYLSMTKDNEQPFISKYALDYLKHKATAQISHKFIYDSSVNWTFLYKDRNGQYLDYTDGQYRLFDYKPYFLTNLKWTKQFKKTRIGVSIENLFDVTYRDLSYIKMPGRWVIFELAYKIK